MPCRPPRSPLFPYTTLFRSAIELGPVGITVNVVAPGVVSGSGMTGEPRVMTREEEIEIGVAEGQVLEPRHVHPDEIAADRKSTRLNSSHLGISYAVFCLKKK